MRIFGVDIASPLGKRPRSAFASGEYVYDWIFRILAASSTE